MRIEWQQTQTYKYKITDEFRHETGLMNFECQGAGDFITLSTDGLLRVAIGYRYDGPSGPAIDSRNFMRGALVHDALYQLMREGDLPIGCRQQADEIMRDVCRDDGMSWLRSQVAYWGVRLFGASSARRRLPFPRKTSP